MKCYQLLPRSLKLTKHGCPTYYGSCTLILNTSEPPWYTGPYRRAILTIRRVNMGTWYIFLDPKWKFFQNGHGSFQQAHIRRWKTHCITTRETKCCDNGLMLLCGAFKHVVSWVLSGFHFLDEFVLRNSQLQLYLLQLSETLTLWWKKLTMSLQLFLSWWIFVSASIASETTRFRVCTKQGTCVQPVCLTLATTLAALSATITTTFWEIPHSCAIFLEWRRNVLNPVVFFEPKCLQNQRLKFPCGSDKVTGDSKITFRCSWCPQVTSQSYVRNLQKFPLYLSGTGCVHIR